MKDIIELLEHKLIMLKRKYRDRGPVYSANYAPIRESVLNFIRSKGKVSYSELKEFIQRFNESEGRNTSIRSFLRTNSKYVIESEKNGERYFKLSEYGKRFLDRKIVFEDDDVNIDKKSDIIKEDDVHVVRKKSYVIELKNKIKFKSDVESDYLDIKNELSEKMEENCDSDTCKKSWMMSDSLVKDIYGKSYDVLDVILTAAFQKNLDFGIIDHVEDLLNKESEEYHENKQIYESIIKLRDLLISGEFSSLIRKSVLDIIKEYEKEDEDEKK
jgi:hypothetical protein